MWKPHKGSADGTLKVYINSLERWVEIGCYGEEKLRQWLDVDIEGLELHEYQRAIVDGWGIAPRFIKKNLSPEAVKEIYEIIVQQHPIMHPRALSGLEPFSNEAEYDAAVRLWFSSKGKRGVMPEVLYPEIISQYSEGPDAA